MSRTYRKISYNKYGNMKAEDVIFSELKEEYARKIRNGCIFLPKTTEEYEEDYKKELVRYQKALQKWNVVVDKHKKYVSERSSSGLSEKMADFTSPYRSEAKYGKPYFYVSRTKRIDFEMTFLEFVELNFDIEYKWYLKHHSKHHLDGRNSESGRKKGYREDTVKNIRNDNKKKIHKLMKDTEEYENMSFYTNKDNKHLIWRYW